MYFNCPGASAMLSHSVQHMGIQGALTPHLGNPRSPLSIRAWLPQNVAQRDPHSADRQTNKITKTTSQHHFPPATTTPFPKKQSRLLFKTHKIFLFSPTHHTQSRSTMDSSHRKIELQSPSDLSYLTSQIRTTARQKLDLHLPPVTSSTAEPDDLRRSVEDLVDAFVAQVLRGMRQNISINGIDVVNAVDDSDSAMQGIVGGEGEEEKTEVEREEFEAFDEKLRTKLGDAVARRDALIAKISQHRRTTPAVAAKAFEESFEREEEEVAGKWVGLEERVKEVREGDVRSGMG